MDWIDMTATDFRKGGRKADASGGQPNVERGRLTETTSFGANPGALQMLAYAPKGLPAGAPLVVVLHGCSQDARKYDFHAGWTTLADELSFATLYPQQRSANNPGGCFNWFLPADTARGLGEARSIREMIETMAARHKIDRSRIFVTGLSAGGAMAAALLSDYPDLFAGGAIIAGLPCGAAASVQEAFEQMARPSDREPADLGDAVRTKSPHAGPWPRISIWHGSADATVAPKNADQLVRQWLDVHGVAAGEYREELFDGHRRRVWSAGGRDVVESTTIAGMGHGTPVDERQGERKGPFMLQTGVSSTRRIASFFGLGEAKPAAKPKPARAETIEGTVLADTHPRAARGGPDRSSGEASGSRRSAGSRPDARHDPRPGVQAVIEKALRAAGLMK